MKALKRTAALVMCVLMVACAILPVCAYGARMNHGVNYRTSFTIDSSGKAKVSLYYEGDKSSFTNVTVETYIQKKSLGLFWTKVDNGQTDKTWVDSSSATSGSFTHTLNLDATGTYRAVFNITFSGTGAAADVIEDEIEYVYG